MAYRIPQLRICTQCDKPYETRSPKALYCSRQCRVNAYEANQGACDWAKCDLPVRARGFCITHYNKLIAYERQEPQFCKLCSKRIPIEMKRDSEVCSDECRKEWRNHYSREWHAKNPDRSYAKTKERRAKMKGVLSEPYKRSEVFERDNWICQLCNKPVDASLEWPNSLSKSVDHIQPVSLGGSDTFDNVQLAHVFCNFSKHNREEPSNQWSNAQ